jgi:hypothetical protein
MFEQEIYAEFWWGNRLGNVQRGDRRITLICFLGRWVVKMGDELNWLRIMSNVGLWY